MQQRENRSAIYFRNVYKSYSNICALKSISLDIKQGESFGLLGPNGAGKSTLINILAGLIRKDSGIVEVLGHDIINNYRFTRKNLGIVPQEVVYDPFFTVEEVLEFQGGYFGIRDNKEWVDELLETLNLQSKRKSNLRQLSGGMKRRLLIAQALVHKPPIVVLDEPTAGVDIEQRYILYDFIKRLQREGHTILLTTHYLEEAERLCNRIAIINEGHIKAVDTTEKLIAHSGSRKIYIFLDRIIETSDLPTVIKKISPEIEGNRMSVRVSDDNVMLQDIFEALALSGMKIVDIETESPGLEATFLRLTGSKRGRELGG